MNFRILLLAPLAAAVLSVSAASPRMPQGWYAYRTASTSDVTKAGLDGYEVGLDPTAGGPPTLTIRSIYPLNTEGPVSVASAYQSLLGYAGKRVRFSGELRAVGVPGWAGLYLEKGFGHLADFAGVPSDRNPPLPLGSAVAADGGWHDVSVVMDVPADALHLGFGLGLVGAGQVWARGLRFELVGPEVAPTATRIGIDLEAAQRFYAASRAQMAKLPPAPLQNAALD